MIGVIWGSTMMCAVLGSGDVMLARWRCDEGGGEAWCRDSER